MDINMEIKKRDVYDEVAKLTSYIGAKATDGEKGITYDRVFATEDDRDMLEQFWRDSKQDLINSCKRFVKTASEPANSQVIDYTEVLTMVMTMPSTFDTNLTNVLQSAMRFYCIHNISSRWVAITEKKEAKSYPDAAIKNMETTEETIYYTKRPKRIVPQ